MFVNPTMEQLRKMYLSEMARAYAEQRERPDIQSLSFDERFAMLVDREFIARKERRINRLLKEAHFRITAAPEDISYTEARGLDRSVMATFLQCSWVSDRQNLILTGPTGIGKTFLSCAIGCAACRLGYRVLYFRTPRLLQEMAAAAAEGDYTQRLHKLASVDLLILDDWGLSPFSDAQGRDLLEVMEDRSEARSTLISSQLPIGSWHGLLKNPTVADAVMDRLVHTAHILTLKGDSMRRKEGKS